MKRPQKRTANTPQVLVAGLVSISLAGCSVPLGASRVHAAGRSALAAKATAAYATEDGSYDNAAVQQLLGSLSYAGVDVAVSLDEVSVEVRDGRVVVWHSYEIPNWEDVPEVMQRESRRCLALACALNGSTVANTSGDVFDFQSVTWVLSDGHDNNYFALVDDGDVAYTATRPLDLFPQADGFVLSDTIYVAISRRESGIPPRSGQTPCDIHGNGIVCTGWLSVPDEMWNVGLPETSENTDDTGYWYDGEIEIESPSTWYQEFIDAEAEGEKDEPEVIVVDEGDPGEGEEGPSGPVVIIDPMEGDDTGDGEGGEIVDPGDIVDPEGGEGTGDDGGEGGGDGGGDIVDPGGTVDPGGDVSGDGGDGGDGGGDAPPEIIEFNSLLGGENSGGGDGSDGGAGGTGEGGEAGTGGE